MKKIPLLFLFLVIFVNSSMAKPYIPMLDSEATLLILKEYRDILNDTYGIELKNNNEILYDESDVAIKGKIFGKAIEEAGFSLEETINKHLDTHKQRLSYGHSRLRSNRKAVEALFGGLESYIFRLKKENISESNISWETRTKMYFWAARRNILKRLDKHIIEANKEGAESILGYMHKFGDVEEEQVRRTLIKFAGLLGEPKNRKQAVEEAKIAISKTKKSSALFRVYQTLLWRDTAENSIPNWIVNDLGDYKSDASFFVTVAYSLSKNPIENTYEVLASNMRYSYNNAAKSDPFTTYVHLNAQLSMKKDSYNVDKMNKDKDAAQSLLKDDWAKQHTIKNINELKDYDDSLPWVAFYCFAPTNTETQDFLNSLSKTQKERQQFIEKKLKNFSSYTARGYFINKKYSMWNFNFKLNINEKNNTVVATITNYGKIKKIEAFGKLDKSPSALYNLELKANQNSFMNGRTFYLSIKEDGSLVGKDQYNNYVVKIKHTPHAFSIIYGKTAEELEKYLQSTKNTETKNYRGITPLMYAIQRNNAEMVNVLLKNNAKVNVADDFGFTALIFASAKSSHNIVKLLIDKGANLNAVDYRKRTALFHSTLNGKANTVRLLLSKGANINQLDSEGNFPLLIATQKGHAAVVHALIKGGADIELRDKKNNSTALMFAAESGYREITQLLLENNSHVNAVNRGGSTALMYAARGGHLDIAKLLLAYGADKHMRNNSGWTAAKFADYVSPTRDRGYRAPPVHKNVFDLLNSNKQFTKKEVSLNLQFETKTLKAPLAQNTPKSKEKSNATNQQSKDGGVKKTTLSNNPVERAIIEAKKKQLEQERAKKQPLTVPSNAQKSQPVTSSTNTKVDVKPSSQAKPVASVKTPEVAMKTADLQALAPTSKKAGKATSVSTVQDKMSLTNFHPDKKNDSCLQAVALNEKPLIGIRLETLGGESISWKTKDVKQKAHGILAVWHDNKLVNANDASFSLDVTKPTQLILCVQADGSLNNAETLYKKMRIIFFHNDGSRNYSVFER